jgi:hypothetical protein
MSKKIVIITVIVIVAILIGLGVYQFVNRGKGNVPRLDSSITMSPETLNPARKNMYYLQTLYTTGFAESDKLDWSLASGTIPSGLILETDTRGCIVAEKCPAVQTSRGLLSGTVTDEPSTYNFTIKIDGAGKTFQKSYELVVK